MVAGALFANVGTEPFPFTIASLPNGGPAFAGKSGRRTANACEAKAMETAIATAAHFMSGRFIKIEQQRKEKLCAPAAIKNRNAATWGDKKSRFAIVRL
jgi:hypothetical protein